jgi:hypothetical protein
MNPGFNTVTWDLRYPGPTTFPNMILWGSGNGSPAAAPGIYQVRMTTDGRVQTQPLRVRRNPMFKDVSDADLQAQFDLAIQIRDKTSEANNAVIRIRDLKSQAATRVADEKADAQLKAAADRFTTKLSTVEAEIYQVKNQSGQDPLNFPIKINNRLAALLAMVARGDAKPTTNEPAILKDLTAELKVQTDALDKILATELPLTNAQLTRLGLTAIK